MVPSFVVERIKENLLPDETECYLKVRVILERKLVRDL